MKIVSSTYTSRDTSNEGGCLIHENISLVEQYGLYTIICIWEIPEGQSMPPDKGADIFEMTTDFEKAKSWYEYYGGKLDVD